MNKASKPTGGIVSTQHTGHVGANKPAAAELCQVGQSFRAGKLIRSCKIDITNGCENCIFVLWHCSAAIILIFRAKKAQTCAVSVGLRHCGLDCRGSKSRECFCGRIYLQNSAGFLRPENLRTDHLFRDHVGSCFGRHPGTGVTKQQRLKSDSNQESNKNRLRGTLRKIML